MAWDMDWDMEWVMDWDVDWDVDWDMDCDIGARDALAQSYHVWPQPDQSKARHWPGADCGLGARAQ